MKKLMMMAVAALFAASANAQTDIVKLVKKAKTYSDAMQLVNQGVSALSNEDKGKVYTKLCELAAKEFSAEQENYIKKDLTPGYDVNNAYTAAQSLLKSSILLRAVDAKAPLKYIAQLNKAREMMLNAGQEGLDNKDYNQVLTNLGLYVDAADVVTDGNLALDPNIPQIAYFSTWGASELKDDAGVMKYSTYALNDSAYGAPAMSLMLNAMEKKVASKQDSVEFVQNMRGMIGKYPGGKADDAILGKIVSFYSAPQYAAEIDKLLDETVAAHPNSDMAWALKGQTALNKMDYDAAIIANKKAIELNPKFTQVRFNLATGQKDKAMTIIDNAGGNVTPEAKALVDEAIANFNQIRTEDPDHEIVQWKYPLAQCYYILGDTAKYEETIALP